MPIYDIDSTTEPLQIFTELELGLQAPKRTETNQERFRTRNVFEAERFSTTILDCAVN